MHHYADYQGDIYYKSLKSVSFGVFRAHQTNINNSKKHKLITETYNQHGKKYLHLQIVTKY